MESEKAMSISSGGEDYALSVGGIFTTSGESSGDEFHARSKEPRILPTSVHWVRMSCLRIHDNPALNHSLLISGAQCCAVFIIDPWFMVHEHSKFGVNRWRFLLESLHDLDRSLRRLNSRLYVAKGQPVAVLENLIKRWNVTHLSFQIDREVHSNALEASVEKLAQVLSVTVSKYSAHTLYDRNKILKVVGHQPVTSFHEFGQVLQSFGPPDLPVDTATDTKSFGGPEDSHEYRIPTMEDVGYPEESLYTNVWIGGETEALRRLPVYCHTRGRPSTNQVDMLFDTTALSPYVRFGCLSVRYFLAKVKDFAAHDPAIEVVAKQVLEKLLQREFFFTNGAVVPNFDSIINNPVCLQLPWESDPLMYAKWRDGRTGYPWIDAAMRQLSSEGWVHACLRESVAAFLTRGDLWISWVKGKDAFEEMLLDYEPSVSCGCWMKSSCSGFINGPVEHYCPITYGQRIDPDGQYIRKYIPELRHFPSAYIYSPWTAPLSVQTGAGCRIGVDYPTPIVDHAIAGALCCERLRSTMHMIQQANDHRHYQFCKRDSFSEPRV